MNNTVCSEKKCTACKACINICPNKCISLKINEKTQTSIAIFDNNKCTKCMLCQKVCPVQNSIAGNKPIMCYAAWSNEKNIRKTCASGGIATELGKYYIEQNCKVAGVKINEMLEAEFCLASDIKSIEAFRNSKYVYSDTGKIYNEIVDILKTGEKILFIGLPCQVAALRKFVILKNVESSNLLTVDLICHGVTPSKFLKEHIKYIENKYKQKAKKIDFRNSDFGTDKFYFSLTNEKGCFYKKKVQSDDVYQIAYHAGVSYRSNCYECQFANIYRQGDLTIGDFWSVGKLEKFEYPKEKVSCVLINTQKGFEVLSKLERKVTFIQRPIEEEVNFEKQLVKPTQITKVRENFLREYSKKQDFEHSMKYATRKIRIINFFKNILFYEQIKKSMRGIVPLKIRRKFKNLFCNGNRK